MISVLSGNTKTPGQVQREVYLTPADPTLVHDVDFGLSPAQLEAVSPEEISGPFAHQPSQAVTATPQPGRASIHTQERPVASYQNEASQVASVAPYELVQTPTGPEYFFGASARALPGREVLDTVDPRRHLAVKPEFSAGHEHPTSNHVAKLPDADVYIRWSNAAGLGSSPEDPASPAELRSLLERVVRHIALLQEAGGGLVQIPAFRAWIGDSPDQSGQSIMMIVEGIQNGRPLDEGSRGSYVYAQAKYLQAVRHRQLPEILGDLGTEDQWRVAADGVLQPCDFDAYFTSINWSQERGGSGVGNLAWSLGQTLRRASRRGPYYDQAKAAIRDLQAYPYAEPVPRPERLSTSRRKKLAAAILGRLANAVAVLRF